MTSLWGAQMTLPICAHRSLTLFCAIFGTGGRTEFKAALGHDPKQNVRQQKYGRGIGSRDLGCLGEPDCWPPTAGGVPQDTG